MREPARLKTWKPVRRSEFDVEISSLSSWVCETRNRHVRQSLMKLLLVQDGFVVSVAC